MKKIILLLFIYVTAINISEAQTELRYEHYTIANGLSSNFTIAATQDQYGLLWVGSIDGLNCFNGYDFTTYYQHDNDLNSLSENSINALLIDKHGTLWVATTLGLNKFNRASNNFQRYFCNTSHFKNATENLIVNSISENDDGNLWIGTDKGIRILNPTTNEITLPDFKDDSLKQFISYGIAGILFDSKGVIWLGSSLHSGFRLADKKTLQPIPFFPDNKKNQLDGTAVRGFFEDSKSTLWILSTDGLYSFERNSNLFKRYKRSEAPNDTLTYSPTSILEDREGVLWVSLSANPPFYTSIAKVDAQLNTFKTYPYVDNDDRGLAWSWASFIFQDRSGIFWVGTSRGLDKMDPLCQQFKLVQQFTNLKYSQYQNIYTILKDSDTMWLGTDGRGLIKYNLITKKFEQVFTEGSFSTAGIWALLQLPDGRLMLGSNDVSVYNPTNKKVETILKSPATSGNSSTQTSCIIKGDNDEIWISWNGAGLTRYNLKTKALKNYRFNSSDKNSICSDQVNVVFRDSKGIIWIGSADGVNVFGRGLPGRGLDRFNPADETFTHFIHRDDDSTSLSNNNVISIAEDKNGALWIGTRNGGLNKFNISTGKFQHYTKNEGLPSNFITAIEVDDDNNIWMSSFTNGLACLNQKTNQIKLFDVTYGLQNIRFNRHGSFKANDGEMFFSGVSGFNSFYPLKLKFNTQPPNILITEIKINNKVYSSDSSVLDIKNLKLNYDQNDLQFDYSAMSFSQSYKNQYAYQLEGYDKKWITAGTTRTAKYTNLDPGKYTFKVKACNNDAVWNETGASISIIITPPWWQTWWAYLFYAVAFVGAVFGFIAYRSKRLQKENKMLEHKVELRTNQLQTSIENLKAAQSQLVHSEKMASLGELTTGIAHEIQNPLNFVNNFSELSNELIDEMNDEIEKGNNEEVKAIAHDVKQNLEKINHHGKRAASIVKGMLLHSRQSSGEKKLININKLVDEFIQLSYHGLRAKDSSFNATIKTDYDENIGKINVAPQEIGRVILNLANNAFYAVSPLTPNGQSPLTPKGGIKKETDKFEPAVWVSTKKIDSQVLISIKDNGNGIPQNVMDKIFQPFFTTKPTGSGTGLGLSLSYDIIKAHGGTITVDSKEGEGTEFTITLPV